jgi:hypothetical protein
MMLNDKQPLDILIGEQMSAVVFVRDYVQLVFDGPGLTAVTPPVVEVGQASSRWGDPGYRDKLCELIGKTVRHAQIVDTEEITIKFDDDSSIRISLRPEDYITAEAAIFSHGERLWVW